MRHLKVFIIAIALLTLGLFVGLDRHISELGSQALNVVSASVTTPKVTGAARRTTRSASINTDLANVLRDYSGLDAAVSLVDLDNGQTYAAGNSTTPYTAASITKILTAVEYLHEVEQGQATLDQTIDGEPAQTLIQNMIEVSDNTAWQDLQSYLGTEQPYAASIGLNSFSGIDDNLITSSDEAKLLSELYQGKLLNDSDRSMLYSYMANTDSTNLISAALPSSATVYHKYGQLDGILNDAAIVSYNGHHFALVIFTNDPDGTSGEYDSQVSLMHDVTSVVLKDLAT